MTSGRAARMPGYALLAAGLGATLLAQTPAPPTRLVPPASPNAASGVTFSDVTTQSGVCLVPACLRRT